MAITSRIEWTNATWNPVTGCSFISEGCKNCYAKRMAVRLKCMGVLRYKRGFAVATHKDIIDSPLQWRKPRFVFINSMGDLFHEDVPLEFIQQVFSTVELASWHIFQTLTKRANRLEKIAHKLIWPANLWVGVTVELQKHTDRISRLSSIPASVKFVSFEPLLGPITRVDLSCIDWAIVGGESGPHSRPMSIEWVRGLRDKCIDSSIPFFFKQWGGARKKTKGRTLDRKLWNEYPKMANKSLELTP